MVARKKQLPVNSKEAGSNYSEQLKKKEDLLNNSDTDMLKKRLKWSLVLLMVLMYFSMGHTMFGWSVAPLTDTGVGAFECLLAITVLIINKAFFVKGFKGLIHGAPNMDTLVALGAGTSFLWSLRVLAYILMYSRNLDIVGPAKYTLADLFFESSAMIVTLITVGKLLEARSKGKTTNALKELMELSPETARVEKKANGRKSSSAEEGVIVPVDEIKPGDILIIKAGERIAVDAVIVEGNASVDESALTGESMPVEKKTGDSISAATINLSGYIRAEATRVGEDTALAQIIQLVSDAAATKAPIARLADKIAAVFVPVVIGIATVVCIIWMLLGQDISYALTRAVAVLVISCPCAMGLATPVAIMVGSGTGARKGILFKTAAALEETGRIKIVALDKTGTITKGEPEVTEVISCEGVSEKYLMDIASLLESRSEHPLAKAISKYCYREDGSTEIEINDFEELAGNGVRAVLKLANKDKFESNTEGKEFLHVGNAEDEVPLFAGSAEFVIANASGNSERLYTEIESNKLNLEGAGRSVVYFAEADSLLGAFSIKDKVREDSKEAIAKLKAMGIKTVMLTGDRHETAELIAEQVGVDSFIAEVKPDGKEAVVRELLKEGKTAMVGDGINDAPALARADIGIAIGAGTAIARNSADVVLVNSSIADVASAITLGRKTLRIIKENLFWAFFYNILLIPLAAGAFTTILGGWTLNPMIAAGAMSLSSFCVCTNALRLGRVRF